MSDWRAQAERAGQTVAFLDIDMTKNTEHCQIKIVGGRAPPFLLMSPRIADRFHELHPEAKRMTLDELEKAIEEKASAEET
jgi:hypothetical protein